jgi:uncharacterized protein YjbI with pentapeptide repeats
MKIQKPKILKESPEIYDFMEVLQEARENETEIEEMHIKSSYLVGEDMTGLRCCNVLFENVRFMECKFQKCSFIDVIFKNCDLSNCDMSQGYFNRCEFITDKAIGIKLNEAIMKDVGIIESNLEYANLTGVTMNVVELVNSNFTSASIAECKLKNLICSQTEFINTNFFKTPLKGIDFTNCTITGMIVSNEGTELKGAIVDLYQAAELAKLFGIIIR